jgi:hypothetical protein
MLGYLLSERVQPPVKQKRTGLCFWEIAYSGYLREQFFKLHRYGKGF